MTNARSRPSRLSMEGYISNANAVLEAALDPKTRQVPIDLVAKCKGVVAIAIHSVGALVSFIYGTGVLGAKRDYTIIFIMDEENMKDFVERPQSRIALDAAVTVGTLGGNANVGMEAPDKGTISMSFTRGAFAGFSVLQSALEVRRIQNETFYGKPVSAKDILFNEAAVEIPPNSQVADLHEKMEMLAKGETWVPTLEEMDRSHHFEEAAMQKSEEFKHGN